MLRGQSKYLVLTVNYDTTAYRWFNAAHFTLEDAIERFGPFTYLVAQKERGRETGNLHFQVYVEYAEKRRRSTWLHNYWQGCHISPRNGTAEEASDYCKKEETLLHENEGAIRHEWGEISLPEPGKRTDWEHLQEMVTRKRPLEEIVDEHFNLYVRYNRGIDRVIDLSAEKRTWKTDIYILWGPSQTGKTTIATKFLTDRYGAVPFLQTGGKWWDGYRGEEGVIVNEFEGSWPYTQWKQICDRGAFRIEKKGTSREMIAKTIIFTSNVDPITWWPEVGLMRFDEIEGRCNGIIHVKLLVNVANVEGDGRVWMQERAATHGGDLPWPDQGPGNIWD